MKMKMTSLKQSTFITLKLIACCNCFYWSIVSCLFRKPQVVKYSQLPNDLLHRIISVLFFLYIIIVIEDVIPLENILTEY